MATGQADLGRASPRGPDRGRRLLARRTIGRRRRARGDPIRGRAGGSWSGTGRDGRPQSAPGSFLEPRSLACCRTGANSPCSAAAGNNKCPTPTAVAGTRRWSIHDAEPAHHWVNNGTLAQPRRAERADLGGTSAYGRPTRAASVIRPCASIGTSATTSSSPPTASIAVALRRLGPGPGPRDGEVVVECRPIGQRVHRQFRPDGRLLVTACRDRTVPRYADWRARVAVPQVRARQRRHGGDLPRRMGAGCSP